MSIRHQTPTTNQKMETSMSLFPIQQSRTAVDPSPNSDILSPPEQEYAASYGSPLKLRKHHRELRTVRSWLHLLPQFVTRQQYYIGCIIGCIAISVFFTKLYFVWTFGV
jgi:hypothetical protein